MFSTIRIVRNDKRALGTVQPAIREHFTVKFHLPFPPNIATWHSARGEAIAVTYHK